MTPIPTRAAALLVFLVLPAAAQTPPAAPPAAAAAPTPAEARAFVQEVNEELKRLTIRASTAEWIKSTYITDDTERNAAAMNEDLMAYLSRVIPEAARFDGAAPDPDAKRMLHLLKVSSRLPAPRDPAKRRELAGIAARLGGLYGKGKWCDTPAPGKAAQRCHDILETEARRAATRARSARRGSDGTPSPAR